MCGTQLPITIQHCITCGVPTLSKWEEVLSSQTTIASKHIAAGRIALTKQRWDKARKHFHQAISVRPTSASAWTGKALAVARQRDVLELIRSARAPGGYIHLQKSREALSFLRKALSVDPKNAEARLLVGYLTDNPTMIETVARETTVRSIATEALKQLATALIFRSFRVVTKQSILSRISMRLFGNRGIAFLAVEDEALLRKALAISVVQGRVDTDTILKWRFPYEIELQNQKVLHDEQESYPVQRFLKDHPLDALWNYLWLHLELSYEKPAWHFS